MGDGRRQGRQRERKIPLKRSALEGRVLGVPGVKAVRTSWLRQHTAQRFRRFSDLVLEVPDNRVLRLDDDPTQPQTGRCGWL